MWEDQVRAVYILDPETGEPASSSGSSSAEADPPAHHNPAAANANAPVNLPAPGAGKHWVIGSTEWSYNAIPTNGALTITDGGTQVFKVYVTNSGPGFFIWNPGKRFSDNSAVVVSLLAGGAGVSGVVNVHAWVE